MREIFNIIFSILCKNKNLKKIFIRQNLFINQFIKINWDIKNLHLDILNVIFYNFNINDFIESGLNIMEILYGFLY